MADDAIVFCMPGDELWDSSCRLTQDLPHFREPLSQESCPILLKIHTVYLLQCISSWAS